MFNDGQRQNQETSIAIGLEKHGMVAEIHCPYYTDERAKYFEEKRNYGDNMERVKNRELYYKSQLVKVIVYEGKTKPICHLFNVATKKCLNKTEENTQCHIA